MNSARGSAEAVRAAEGRFREALVEGVGLRPVRLVARKRPEVAGDSDFDGYLTMR